MSEVEFAFEHAHIFCTDIDATERFLCSGLGATVVERRRSQHLPALTLDLHGLTVYVRPRFDDEDIVAPERQQFGLDHLGLRVNDVDAAVEVLRGRGVEIEVEPWNFMPGSRIAFVRGPDRIRVELTQRGATR
jgi:lactoylglutathione lyase